MMRSKTVALVALFHLAVAVSVAEGRYQRWIPNTDFDNPRNWKSGKVPCRNEHVRFPPSVASVFVQRNHTVMEIILPKDGEIILGQDVVFSFPSTSEVDATCRERETMFNGSTPMSWYSPDNWCEMSDGDSESCLEERPRRLHVESIPCPFDDVVFTSATGFSVDIASGAEIRINTLHIGNEPYTQRALRQYLGTEAGRRQFARNGSAAVATTIRIAGQSSCNDVTGCSCNNDQLKDKICGTLRSSCQQPICQNALLPRGHCCQICGAVLNLDFGSGFRITTIQNILKNLHQPPVTKRSTRDENVWWIVSKIDTGTEVIIQVVIADNGDGENAVKVAYKLKEELQKDMKGRRRYGVTHLEMHVSGSADPENERHTGDDESSYRSSATKIVTILIVLLLVIIAVVIIVCLVTRRRGQRIPVSRKYIQDILTRWLTTGQGEVIDESTLHQPHTVEYVNESYDRRAENVFHGEFIDLQDFGAEDVQSTDGARRGGYNNPLYGSEPGVQEIVSQMSSRRLSTERTARSPYGEEAAYEDMQQTRREQQQQPFTSKVAAAFKGLKPDLTSSGRQRFENEEDDENGNAKRRPEPGIEDLSGVRLKSDGKEGEVADVAGQKKKRGKKTRKNTKGEKHQILDESEDSDENETTRKPRKAQTETTDAGFSNPCYDTPDPEQIGSRTSHAEYFRTGFANPAFDEQSRRIEGADAGDSNV